MSTAILEPLEQETLTGELVDVADKAEARALTQRIRSTLIDAQQLVIEAFEKKVWIALGYKSWNAYVTYEFTGLELNPPKEERVAAIAQYTTAGMSTRAISAVMGVHHATVARGVAEAQEQGLLDEETISEGLDGRIRVSSKKKNRSDTGDDTFELADDVLDTPAEDLGIGFFKTPAGKGQPSQRKKEAQTEKSEVVDDEKTTTSADFIRTGFDSVEYHLNELVQNIQDLVLGNGDENFSTDQYSSQMVEAITRGMASTVHLFKRMNIQPDLFGELKEIESRLEAIVTNLDTELTRLQEK
ncbi:helix-turn-helix domain-containing protein [Rothia sp. P5764]|uniref:helix-turn-helix domain-containing protein n=1 Tax=Rothia sp. P5764 TaxID=3402654 RepID=UPI003AD0AF63